MLPLSTLALSVSGALYDAAKYIPAADVMSTGLGPCITRQQRVGWVVWSATISSGLDVREATKEEIAAEVERLRADDLKRRRAEDPDAAEIDLATFALGCHEYHAHMWADVAETPAPYVVSQAGAIGAVPLT